MQPQPTREVRELGFDLRRLKSELSEYEALFRELKLQGASGSQPEDVCRACTNLTDIEQFR